MHKALDHLQEPFGSVRQTRVGLDKRKDDRMRSWLDEDSRLRKEYRALSSQAGLVDRSHLTKIRLLGCDSFDLLQRISTNDLNVLSPGEACSTVLTTEKGRIIDLLTVYRFSKEAGVLLCHAPAQRVLDWVRKFIVMDDVQVRDESEELGVLSIIGPESGRVLQQVLKVPLMGAEGGSFRQHVIAGVEFVVLPIDPEGGSGYNLLAQAKACPGLLRSILAVSGAFGLIECSTQALDVVRIERGVAIYGCDFTEEVNPLEAGLEKYVSFTKGCYVGQEVIARLETYKKLQKRMMGLRLPGSTEIDSGSTILYQGNAIGEVRSSTYSIALAKTLALAYIRSQWADSGRKVSVMQSGESIEGELVELPLVQV